MPPRSRLAGGALLYSTSFLVVFTYTSAQAQQVVPPPFPSQPPPFQEQLEPVPPPHQVLPPPPPPSLEKPSPLPSFRVFVREIRVAGSTALTPEELAKIAAPYTNRELTSEDLEALRLALTVAYVNRGYVNSGAIIPDQDVKEGVITYQIVEGELTAIEVEGNEWFRAGYLQDRIALGAGKPVNINALQERLQLLQQDDRLQRLNAELKPGLQAGESVLKVRVAEASPYKMWLEFNNFQPPTVGAERGLVTVAHQNLTGNGDRLSVQYGKSEGVNPQIDARYALPINAYDTTLILHYRKNDFQVIDPTFEALHITSASEIYGVTIRHPLYRTLNDEVALSLTGEHLANRLSVPDIDAELFAPGSRGGQTVVTAFRFTQEWVRRAPSQVIAMNSRMSLGVDLAGAVTNNRQTGGVALPDARFFSWLGQFQYARRLDPWGIQIIGRVDCQLSHDRLFPSEQMSVGGRYSVRGYRENELVQDNGLIGSLEFRLPVVRSAAGHDIVQIAPFMDFGRSWRRKPDYASGENAHGTTLTSAGLGFIWNVILYNSRLEAYWGKRLNSVPVPERGLDIQDYGFHLQLVVEAY